MSEQVALHRDLPPLRFQVHDLPGEPTIRIREVLVTLDTGRLPRLDQVLELSLEAHEERLCQVLTEVIDQVQPLPVQADRESINHREV